MSGNSTYHPSEIYWGKMQNAPQGETVLRIGQYVRRSKRCVVDVCLSPAIGVLPRTAMIHAPRLNAGVIPLPRTEMHAQYLPTS
jgi:hypothetical protein